MNTLFKSSFEQFNVAIYEDNYSGAVPLKKTLLFCANNHNKHIMPYLNCISRGSTLYVILPKSEGPFINFLVNKKFIWTEKNLIPLFKQILKGLQFLHSYNIPSFHLMSSKIHVTYYRNKVNSCLHKKSINR